MHPRKERGCDELLVDPLLATPPPEPEKPRPPRIRKPREFKLAPRFPLLDKQFYVKWSNHQKELQLAKPKVDDKAPPLYPELYLKPRRLDFYARQVQDNLNSNKELLKRINYIQRTGGFVDCWMRPEPTNKMNRMLIRQRQIILDDIAKDNIYFYNRLQNACRQRSTYLQKFIGLSSTFLRFAIRDEKKRSMLLQTKELNKQWKETKHQLMSQAIHPFVLFDPDQLDKGYKDPAFDKAPYTQRSKVIMDMGLKDGAKIGKVMIELFNEIVPDTCQLFLNLVKGDGFGHAYKGTRFFRVVPNLYCRGGDVVKDNGFGIYIPKGEQAAFVPENFQLNHSVPGVLSMAITKDNEVSGQFNIIFKPLPQFDGKHVVFGRIISGPTQFLERISALGLPLGTVTSSCIIKQCGFFSAGQYRDGNVNTTKFPPRRKTKLF